MVVGGGETQQELIPLKHKEWSVVDLVLSELTMTGMALEGTGARVKDARGSSEIVAYTLK